MFADKIQIQQVLVNLMRNALKSLRATAADQRSIRVAIRKHEEDRSELSLPDNRPGPTDRSSIGWPLHSTPPGEEDCMRIGVLIGRRIEEAHGGTIAPQNNDLGGATFRSTVPGIKLTLGEE